jgi:hypothetical protein
MTTLLEKESAEEKKRCQDSKAALIDLAITSIKNKIEADKLNGTIADLVRLLQLQDELEEQLEPEQPREIKVTWVDSEEPEHASRQ